MAGPNQSKKETIGIELPVPPPKRPPDPNIKPRETARIQLPVREPMDKPPLPIPFRRRYLRQSRTRQTPQV